MLTFGGVALATQGLELLGLACYQLSQGSFVIPLDSSIEAFPTKIAFVVLCRQYHFLLGMLRGATLDFQKL